MSVTLSLSSRVELLDGLLDLRRVGHHQLDVLLDDEAQLVNARRGSSGSASATCSVESARPTGRHWYIRAVLAGIGLQQLGRQIRARAA